MKLAYFFIDDVIWVMRDLARQKPKSLFDNEFMKMLKKAHDETGMTVQLNLFYRTDFYYGDDEFTLAEMPDIYKAEFEEASDWLRLAFHAKQEFPDYPYVNASYRDVKANYHQITNEIIRFAGEKSVAAAVCPHWLPVSKEGCKALADCGVKFMSPTYGERKEFDGDDNALPYGHSFRLKQNRKPETMLFTRKSRNAFITESICAYNHISQEQYEEIEGTNTSIWDEETGLRFKRLCSNICLNLNTVDNLIEDLEKHLGDDYIGVATHEQYFYPEYFAYQTDYAEKIYLFSRVLKENGYRFITSDEME